MTTYKKLQALVNAGVWELRFSNMQRDYAISILDEIQELNDTILIDSIIENWRERMELDKLIHVKLLFPNPKGFNG